jgi:sodium-dependent dicarboxylate transporter 2/3/5
MLGFMLATVLISMWISNAAASAMMVPIVQAVLEEIYEKNEHDDSNKVIVIISQDNSYHSQDMLLYKKI